MTGVLSTESIADAAQQILSGQFAGKRDAMRTCRFLDILVEGRRATFKAMAIDISRSGILVRVMDPAFATEEESGHLIPYTARVWHHFEDGITVHFLDGMDARADVVRVTGYCGRGTGLILVGCRFRRELDPHECTRLGIDHSDDGSAA